MSMAETKVKDWGNSLAVILPKNLANHEGIRSGDIIKIEFSKSRRVDGFGMIKGAPEFKREDLVHEEFN